MAEILLVYKAKINAKDRGGHQGIVKLLLDHRADFEGQVYLLEEDWRKKRWITKNLTMN